MIAKKFYGLRGVDEKRFEFSLLYTALGYENIYRFVGMRASDDVAPTLIGARVKDLILWIYAEDSEGQTILGESRRLGLLAAVVANDRALAELRKSGSLDRAVRFTKQPLASFRAAIDESISATEAALDLLFDVASAEPEDTERSDRLIRNATRVSAEVGKRLRNGN